MHAGRACFHPVSGRLDIDGRTSTLRPRTAAFLAHLVRHGDCLVTKDELMAAVWPDAVVTEDSLVQCAKEIRQALGGAARDWIRTIPRQGYAYVATPTQGPPPQVAGSPGEPTHSRRWGVWVALAFVVTLALLGSTLQRSGDHGLGQSSVVVLPLANHTGDGAREAIAEDLTESLAAALARVPGMTVISPSTAFSYKDKPIDVRRIGSELGVRYVLEGSLRGSALQPVLALYLTDARTAALLWSGDFAGAGESLHEDVLARVAQSFSLHWARAEATRSQRERPHDPTAADLLARARGVLRWAPEDGDTGAAQDLLEESVRRDAALDEAWALLARTYLQGARFSPTQSQDLERAGQAAEHAIALAPDSALAHGVKAWVLYNQKRMNQSLAAFDRALELNPNEPWLLSGRGASLVMLGRPEEALGPIERAIRLSPRDPLVPQWQMFHGVADLHLGHVDRAVEWLVRSVDSNPGSSFARLFLASALGGAGRIDEAQMQLAEFERLRPGFTLSQFRAREPSDAPSFLKQRERVYSGLRHAGMRE